MKRCPFSVVERIVLRDLNVAEGGLSAYTFWRRYKVGPACLFAHFIVLPKKNL